jgi:hypothetical protein
LYPLHQSELPQLGSCSQWHDLSQEDNMVCEEHLSPTITQQVVIPPNEQEEVEKGPNTLIYKYHS